MHVLLGFLAAVCLLMGLAACVFAKVGLEQAAGYFWFLLAGLFFVGEAVVTEIRSLRKHVEERDKPK